MIACLSLATICDTETPKAIEAAGQGGFSHVELWWPRLRSDLAAAGADPILSALEACNIQVAGCAGVGLELVGSEELWRESLNRALDMFQRIQPLAPPLISFTTGLTHEQPQERLYEIATQRLMVLEEIATSYPFELALEFRSDSRWLTSLDTAAALLSQLSQNRIGICLDLFHFMTGPSKIEDLNRITVEMIRNFQCSDLIGTPREIARESDRILPGEGDFEIRPVMERLVQFSYSGLVTVEVPNPLLWNIAPDRVADMAYQSLFRFWPEDDSTNDPKAE